MRKVTLQFLRSKGACTDGYTWFKQEGLHGQPIDKIVKHFIKKEKLDWGNWLIVRCMSYEQYVKYAVYAAKQVLAIYEEKYPGDKRPREAVNAASICAKNPSPENKAAAAYAADAADAAAYAAAYDAAYAAAAAAAYAADAAAAAAYDAAYAAAAAAAYAADAAAYAADAAAYDAAYAKKEMRTKILQYGINLLRNK